LPDVQNEQETAEWLIRRFERKDRLLEFFEHHGYFPMKDCIYNSTQELHSRYRIVFAAWSLVVCIVLRLLTGSNTVFITTLLLTALTLYRSLSHRYESQVLTIANAEQHELPASTTSHDNDNHSGK
jgi:hypothetical protein